MINTEKVLQGVGVLVSTSLVVASYNAPVKDSYSRVSKCVGYTVGLASLGYCLYKLTH